MKSNYKFTPFKKTNKKKTPSEMVTSRIQQMAVYVKGWTHFNIQVLQLWT